MFYKIFSCPDVVLLIFSSYSTFLFFFFFLYIIDNESIPTKHIQEELNNFIETDYTTNKYILNCVQLRIEQNSIFSKHLIHCLDHVWYRHFPIELLSNVYFKDKLKRNIIKFNNNNEMDGEKKKEEKDDVDDDDDDEEEEQGDKHEGFIHVFTKNISHSNDWNLYKLKSTYPLLLDHVNSNSLIASHCSTSIRPPLWLIYSLIRHPYLSQRECVSIYCIILYCNNENSLWNCDT